MHRGRRPLFNPSRLETPPERPPVRPCPAISPSGRLPDGISLNLRLIKKEFP